MPTTADLINETLRLLSSGQREQQNKLSVAATSSDATLTMTYELAGIKPGTLLGIDLEDLWVWEVNEGGKTATVERGHRGSTAASHVNGSLVAVNPRFSRWQVFEAINDEIASLVAEGLFRIRTVDLTSSAATQGYDLTSVTDIIDVYKVLWETTGTSKLWPEARFGYNSDMNTTEFASGKMITVYDSVPVGQTIRVFYKSGFSLLTSLTNDVAAISGVPASMHDILTLGAAARLVEPREVRRADLNSQGDSRRGGEVERGSQLSAGGTLKARRDQRVQAEIRHLSAVYPPKLKV